MTVHAARSTVLDTIETYNTYKKLLIIIGTIAIADLILAMICNRYSVGLPLINIWTYGIVSLVIIYVWAAVYVLSKWSEVKTHYVGIHNCFFRVTEEGVACRQMLHDGSIESFALPFEYVAWVTPSRTPGFYIARTDDSVDTDEVIFPENRRAVFVIATAYNLDDFKVVYDELEKSVKDVRNSGRSEGWKWPEMKDYRLLVVYLVIAALLVIPWRVMFLISFAYAPIIYEIVTIVLSITVVIVLRRRGAI